MKVSTVMSKREKQWQAEEDARALARAKEIQDDSGRLKAAQKAAKGLVNDRQKYLDEQQEELAGLKRLAKKAK